MRLHDFLDYWSDRQPEVAFAAQGERRLSYGEARRAVHRLAWAFVRDGLQLGDRVGVLAKNSIEYLLLYFAASRAGVVLVPLNYRLAPPEWAVILDDARPRILLAAQPFRDAIDSLRTGLASVEHFVALDAGPAPGWFGLDDW